MKYAQLLVVASAMVALPVTAQAAKADKEVAATAAAVSAPVAVAPNAMVFAADGRRIGRVDHVRGNSASIIFNGHYVDVPVSTLSARDGGFVSTLSTVQIVKR